MPVIDDLVRSRGALSCAGIGKQGLFSVGVSQALVKRHFAIETRWRVAATTRIVIREESMRAHLAMLGMVGALLMHSPVAYAEDLTADTILSGGKIVTLNSKGDVAESIAVRDWPHPRDGNSGRRQEVRRPAHQDDRPQGPHRHSGPDQLAHSRHPRRPHLCEHARLVRRQEHQGSAGRRARGGARFATRLLDHGAWRLEQGSTGRAARADR